MNSRDIVAEKGGHKIIEDTNAYTATDYHFYGFIPHEDVTFTSLAIGDTDVTPTGLTYVAGIYYGAPAHVAPGYYTAFELAGGKMTLVLTLDSPTKY